MNKKIMLSFLLFLFVTSLQAQTFLRGQILEDNSNQSIPYANLSIGPLTGTGSNDNGEFLLKIEPELLNKRITVSCLGYSTKSFSVDSLVAINNDLKIYLSPFSILLEEVTVWTKKMEAVKIVQEAITKIPENYTQQPFNMEFYSKIMVNDETKTYYTVENIIETYRSGYIEGVENRSRVLEKRITGESPIKEAFDKKKKVKYFPYEYIAVFDIFIADVIGVGRKYNYTVFNPDYFQKLDFKHSGISVFEGDTVNVIEYSPKKSKKSVLKDQSLLISAKDQAILKHNRTIGEITLEISYRKWGEKYFPYFIKAVYPVNQKGEKYSVILEIYIRKITTKNVKIFKNSTNWHLDDIQYNAEYWNENYPIKKD